jgi:formylglycine-generating enzyme
MDMKKLFTFAAALSVFLVLGGCASVAVRVDTDTAVGPSSKAAATETVSIDLGEHPDWLLLPPIEEGYFFGIGVHDDLFKAKQLSIINAGQQFSTRITSSLEERSASKNGANETVVTAIDKQVTDQVVYGAKFIDQYQDPQGRYWVLARAPLNCMLDAAEGVLLSYRLDVGQEEETIKAVIDAVEEEVKEVAVYFKTEGTLSVSAVTNGKLYVDGELVSDITGGAGETEITLETGIHEVELRYSNGEREKSSVFIMKDLTAAVSFGYKDPVPEGFVLVKAGTFTMGSPTSESKDSWDDDERQHEVSLSRDFYISKYEVTQEEWENVMGNNPVDAYGGIGDNNPVCYISWYDAVEYCYKRSEQEGLTPAYTINKNRNDPNNKNKHDDVKWTVTCDFTANGYRLPTEAEWEYAARGGHKAGGYNIYAGSDNIDDVAWYGNNSGSKAHPVGGRQANELGIYDMSGNVYEWCWDWYVKRYNSSISGKEPTGPTSGYNRVYRGGSTGGGAQYQRVANRYFSHPSFTNVLIGFRVVRTAE